MIPLWKKPKNSITKDEYNALYKDTFYDSEDPIAVIHTSAEGAVDFKALLYIPAKAPYNYYSKEYEKGLKLYTNGVMITEKCEDLLPDHFSFVKGIVDTEIELNLSRETVQKSKSLTLIANNIEKKVKQELESLLVNDREKYEKLFTAFGLQLKFGIYTSYGMLKEQLQDLLLYYSIKQNKFITLKEYTESMTDDQKFIYYATGKTVEGVKVMPQLNKILDKGYDIICMTDDVDEFALRFMGNYKDKEYRNVYGDDLGLEDDEIIESDADLSLLIKDLLGDRVEKVRISNRIKDYAVCFTTEGEISIEMEKVLNAMPGNSNPIKAKKILEINSESAICSKLREVNNSGESLAEYAETLFGLAQLLEGMTVKNPTELVASICNLISK